MDYLIQFTFTVTSEYKEGYTRAWQKHGKRTDRDKKREREVWDVWVDTGHGGDRRRGLMRGEPEEKQCKDRQREGSRGEVRRKEWVIDGALGEVGGKEEETGRWKTQAVNKWPRIESRCETWRNRWGRQGWRGQMEEKTGRGARQGQRESCSFKLWLRPEEDEARFISWFYWTHDHFGTNSMRHLVTNFTDDKQDDVTTEHQISWLTSH